MFYLISREESITIPPYQINRDIEKNIHKSLQAKVVGRSTWKHGITIAIVKLDGLENTGVIDTEDGSVHFKVGFQSLVLRPKVNEVIPAQVIAVSAAVLKVQAGPLDILIDPTNLPGEYWHDAETNTFYPNADDQPMIKVGSKVWTQLIDDKKLEDESWVLGKIVNVDHQ